MNWNWLGDELVNSDFVIPVTIYAFFVGLWSKNSSDPKASDHNGLKAEPDEKDRP
jgi:hypothetical protein